MTSRASQIDGHLPFPTDFGQLATDFGELVELGIAKAKATASATVAAATSVGVFPTQHPAWVQSAVDWLAPSKNVVTFGGGELHRGAPLVRRDSWPRRLSLIGASEVGEPSELFAGCKASLEAAAHQLSRQPLAIDIARVPENSPTVAVLKQAFKRRGVVLTRPANGTPYIDLDSSWEVPELKFNAGRRSDFRRAERHAQKVGGLSFDIHSSQSEEELDRLLDEAFAVEARSWKGDGGTALACDPVLGPFFRRFAHAAAQAGILRLAFVRVGGTAIGMQLGVEWQQRLWLMKIGYDPAYSRCSPGNLLMLHTIRDAALRGLKSYEFLGDPAPWTAQWTTALRPCLQLRLFPYSIQGMLALAQDLSISARARFDRFMQGKQKPGDENPSAAVEDAGESSNGSNGNTGANLEVNRRAGPQPQAPLHRQPQTAG